MSKVRFIASGKGMLLFSRQIIAESAPADVALPAITVSAVTLRKMTDRIIASGMIADYTTSLVNGTTEVASFPDGSPTLADDGRSLSLLGWLTMASDDDTTFPDATAAAVAAMAGCMADDLK